MPDDPENGQNPREPAKGGRHRKGAAEAAAAGLARGLTVRAAAKAAGVGERTLTRWQKDAKFRRRVDRLRQQMISAAVGTLSATMNRAARTLAELLTSADEGSRFRAAKCVLETGLRLKELEDLERRVRELEDRAGAKR